MFQRAIVTLRVHTRRSAIHITANVPVDGVFWGDSATSALRVITIFLIVDVSSNFVIRDSTSKTTVNCVKKQAIMEVRRSYYEYSGSNVKSYGKFRRIQTYDLCDIAAVFCLVGYQVNCVHRFVSS